MIYTMSLETTSDFSDTRYRRDGYVSILDTLNPDDRVVVDPTIPRGTILVIDEETADVPPKIPQYFLESRTTNHTPNRQIISQPNE